MINFKESDFDRVFAVGDIHGNSKLLDDLLSKIEPTNSDKLIFLGDLINRGPDSKGVINRLLELRQTVSCNFILGNHDEMLLGALAGGKDNIKFFTKFGQSTIDNYGLNFKTRNFPRDHALFIADMNDYIVTDNCIFVHAAVDPAVEIERQTSVKLRWTCISKVASQYGGLVDHLSGKKVVCGHESDSIVRKYGNSICIDTGCSVLENGGLTAYNVKTDQIITVR